MIQLWNSRVNKKDTVYILGDLAFGEVEDNVSFSDVKLGTQR